MGKAPPARSNKKLFHNKISSGNFIKFRGKLVASARRKRMKLKSVYIYASSLLIQSYFYINIPEFYFYNKKKKKKKYSKTILIILISIIKYNI